MSAYFLLVCVSIVSMLLDLLTQFVGDLQVEVFPHHGEFQTGGGKTTYLGGVRKSKKIQMYSDRFKSLVEYCDVVYACDVCGGMLCVMNIYIYIQSDVVEYRPGMST
jgi:hypothetical protein